MAEKCPKCGAPMENNRCEYCGYKEEVPSSREEVPSSSTTVPPQATQPRPQPQTVIHHQTAPNPAPRVASRKNKLVALLLCIFLGYLGVHRFYVGKTGTGILYLLTGGLAGIGWIVDIITIATGSFKDQFNLPLCQ